ncbi:MAG: hypothetical protein UH850_11220 [Paludibacteraceae bacterium]|nr:hypothetical protein [Paludibacteraceae bacterium]
MATVNSKMTAIADEIRTLSGTSDSMGLDAMATHVGEANDEVDSQVELLAQAVAALEGKASGSSGSGEDVTAETDEYTAKLESLGTAIAELEAELEGKAGSGSGGGSVETCTVTINSCSTIEYICATTLSNEKIGGYYFNSHGSEVLTTITVENVVCGSFIGLYSVVSLPAFSIVNGGETIDYGTGFITIKAPLEAGVHCIISISNNA